MANLFHFNTLDIKLERETKSVIMTLGLSCLTQELLFEIESFLNWLATHPEIEHLVITSSTDKFSDGLTSEQLKFFQPKNISTMQLHVRKIIMEMLHLPQIIVADLRNGASNLAIELALAADIRIAAELSLFDFNFLELGIIPSSTGIPFLIKEIGITKAKEILLINRLQNADEMQKMGLLTSYYSETSNLFSVLKNLSTLPPIAKLQMRKTFSEQVLSDLSPLEKPEQENATAVNFCEDYKEAARAKEKQLEPNFSSFKMMKSRIQAGEFA